MNVGSFFLYGKFLNLSTIVYNDNEIEMSMTKERREYFAMTLIMRFFGLTALSDYRERIIVSRKKGKCPLFIWYKYSLWDVLEILILLMSLRGVYCN